jgi:hypothetical protein
VWLSWGQLLPKDIDLFLGVPFILMRSGLGLLSSSCSYHTNPLDFVMVFAEYLSWRARIFEMLLVSFLAPWR